MNRNTILAGLAAVIILAGAVALGMAIESRVAAPDGNNGQQSTTAAKSSAPEAPPVQHMQLEAQYEGPLRDTLIQRWRDPLDGTICYVYLPIIVQHGAGPANLVQYGSNNIGSLSCLRPR